MKYTTRKQSHKTCKHKSRRRGGSSQRNQRGVMTKGVYAKNDNLPIIPNKDFCSASYKTGEQNFFNIDKWEDGKLNIKNKCIGIFTSNKNNKSFYVDLMSQSPYDGSSKNRINFIQAFQCTLEFFGEDNMFKHPLIHIKSINIEKIFLIIPKFHFRKQNVFKECFVSDRRVCYILRRCSHNSLAVLVCRPIRFA